MKKPKPAKIMAPAHPFTASGAQTTTVWAKPTKKPKPATAGEKIVIAGLHASKFSWVDVKELHERKRQFEIHRGVAKAIDRAIARAVRKERERCVTIIDACRRGLIDMSRADEMIENGE